MNHTKGENTPSSQSKLNMPPITITFPGGAVLEATWVNGEPHGPSRLTTSESVCESNYAHGTPASSGIVTFTDGRVYEGELKDFKPHGEGVIKYLIGISHRGKFEDGVCHGPGVRTFPGGTVLESTWVNDEVHGPGRLTTPEGVCEIDYAHGVPASSGTVIRASL